MGFAVDLLNQQASLGGVAKVQLRHVLLFSGDIGGLRCGVNDMAVGTIHFLHNIGARLQAGDSKAAIGAGLIGADDGAAGAGGAAQIAHPEHSALQGLAGDGIIFPDYQSGQGGVLKNQLRSLVIVHIDGLLGRITEGISGGRVNLHHLVPAGIQLIQVDLAVFVGVVEVLIQLLIGAVLSVVLGYPKLKLCPLQGIAGDRIHLLDGQARLLFVLNGDFGGLTGPQIDLMGGGVQDISVRGLDFGDDVIALIQVDVLNGNGTVRAYGEVPDLHACLGLDLKDGPRQGVAVDVHLVDGQCGPLVVLELHRGVPVRLQRHLLGGGVQDIPLRYALLGDGINAGQQVLNGHGAVLAGGFGGNGGAVRIVQCEGDTGDGLSGVLISLADGQVGPLVILNGDGRGLTGEQLDVVFGGV